MRRLASIALSLLLIEMLGCSKPTSPPSTAPSIVATLPEKTSEPGLLAVISVGAEPNTVQVEYRNNSNKEVVVSEQVMITGQLALDVFDNAALRRSTVPPPVPWARDDGVRIPVNGKYRVVNSLHMFNPPLEPGHYRVRVSIEGWASEPFEFEVSTPR